MLLLYKQVLLLTAKMLKAFHKSQDNLMCFLAIWIYLRLCMYNAACNTRKKMNIKAWILFQNLFYTKEVTDYLEQLNSVMA